MMSGAVRLPASDGSGGEGVVPQLAELIALRGKLPGMRAARRGRGGVSGRAPSALRGRGMEYAESREYVAGDDARHIDWKLSARTGVTHTKTFQTERERMTLIVADTSPALYFGTRVRFKSVQAARAGAVAVWSALREGDRLAALRGTVAEAPVAPAGGVRGVLRVLDALARWYRQPPAADAGLQAALEQASRLAHPGARIVVLADPDSAQMVPAALWSGLSMHADVELLLLVDPLEQSPPACLLPLATPAGRVALDLAAAGPRQAWHSAFAEPVENLCRALAGHRVRVRVLATDDPSDAWLQGGGERGAR